MATVHLIIKGKVQGVFFRATAKEVADGLGLKGWVKNTFDDNVEAMATGDDKLIQQFISWCRKGPRRAEVTDVQVTKKEETAFTDFSVIR